MEEEESEKRITKKDEKFPALLLLNEIVGQIYKLESALNETVDEILPPMNELIFQSHLGSINLPSLQSEFENTQNFAEKCKRKLAEKEQMRMVQSELVKLEEQISSANQLLAYDVDLKDVNNPEDIGEKARNIENMEQLIVLALDKLKDNDRSMMTNEQRINMEKMLDEAMPLIDKLRILREYIIAEKELEDQIGSIKDNIEGLFIRYLQPQPYTTAINDIGTLQRSQNQIMDLLHRTMDKEQIVLQNLPSYHLAVNTMMQKIEKTAEDIKKLLSTLTEDVSIQEQLVEMQNDLISRLIELSNRVIVVRSAPYDETQPLRLEELKNELGESTITKETEELQHMVVEALNLKVMSARQQAIYRKAVDDLKNGRSHLIALQNAYDELEGIPDTDSLRQKIIDEISTLSEQYDDVERKLEDRLDMLNKFDEIADNVNKKLMDLENNVHQLEVPSASCELSVADKGFNDVNKLRESLEKLSELKEQLTPLLKPAFAVEDFDNQARTGG
uniref:Dynactin subunit 2 n=1 Tax=Loa loa TaxID=7209 RepID=A0A1I7VDB5_LOALO